MKRTSSSASRFSAKVELNGSERQIPPGTKSSPVNLSEVIEITVKLRRKNPIENYVSNLGKTNKILSQEEFEKQFGASEGDIALVEEYAHQHDLTIVQTSAPQRSVILKGTVQNFSKAFGVFLSNYEHADGKQFRGRTGSIHIPAELEGIVEGVFGLDNRPQASPMFHVAKKDGHFVQPKDTGQSYNPTDIAKAYNYPTGVTGNGQCIALIELGGGYRAQDMTEYFTKIGSPLPVIRSVSVDGGVNSPSTADSADGEVVLDIQVAGAVAPGAAIVVYFAPNTDKGFLDAVSNALHDKKNNPSVISISWGASESQWSQQAMYNYNQTFMSAAALGVTITAAAGDHGSSDGQNDGKAHVDFPASSPYVVACGGTTLSGQTETVWNSGNGWATGGGISNVFPVPDYQAAIKLPSSVNAGQGAGRGLPDIAGNADSATGYNVLVDGRWAVIGGTSAVAPLIAGLIALTNEKLQKRAGYLHPRLYAMDKKVFKDIISGDNISDGLKGYKASAGWDACTGLGVPLGAIADALSG
jgi:kumamolisin